MVRPLPGWHPTERGIRLAVNRDRLRAARLDAGLTQEQTAHAVGLTVAHYCKIENGTHRTSNYRTIKALEEFFEIDLDAHGIDTWAQRQWQDSKARAAHVRLAHAEAGHV